MATLLNNAALDKPPVQCTDRGDSATVWTPFFSSHLVIYCKFPFSFNKCYSVFWGSTLFSKINGFEYFLEHGLLWKCTFPLLWDELYSPKIYFGVLLTSTSECDPVWRQSVFRGNQITRSFVWALLLIKRENMDTDKMSSDKPRREAWNRSFPYGPQKESISVTPWVQTSSSWHNIFLLFKPPNLWFFVLEVLAN